MSFLFFSLFTITIVMIATYSKALQSCNVAHICKIVIEMMTSSLLLHLIITPTTTITKIERKNSLQLCKLSPLLLARPPTLTGGESINITAPSTDNNLAAWEEKKSRGEQQEEQNIKPGRSETLAPHLAFFMLGIVQPALGGKNYIVVIIVIIIFHHFDSIIITIIITMW